MRYVTTGLVARFLSVGVCSVACADVFPTLAPDFGTYVPFGRGPTTSVPVNYATTHEVFDNDLFIANLGGQPVARIETIAFAPRTNGQYKGDVTLRLGYTNAVPGVTSALGGLAVPVAGGGGAPNASGAMTDFFVDHAYLPPIFALNSDSNFQMVFDGLDFNYDPSLGNLLVEIVSICDRNSGTIDLRVSAALYSSEASMAYNSTRGGQVEAVTPGYTTLRIDFGFVGVPEPASAALLVFGVVAVALRRFR